MRPSPVINVQRNALALILIAALSSLSLGACNNSSNSGGGAGGADALFAVCEDPRSQACTREYLPVCARLGDGRLSTFANACTACANAAVEGHYPGACAAPAMTACTSPRPELCTADFNPVCGQRISGDTRTFGNACQACADISVIGHFQGQCP